jgi:hypothetical protein
VNIQFRTMGRLIVFSREIPVVEIGIHKLVKRPVVLRSQAMSEPYPSLEDRH